MSAHLWKRCRLQATGQSGSYFRDRAASSEWKFQHSLKIVPGLSSLETVVGEFRKQTVHFIRACLFEQNNGSPLAINTPCLFFVLLNVIKERNRERRRSQAAQPAPRSILALTNAAGGWIARWGQVAKWVPFMCYSMTQGSLLQWKRGFPSSVSTQHHIAWQNAFSPGSMIHTCQVSLRSSLRGQSKGEEEGRQRASDHKGWEFHCFMEEFLGQYPWE